MRKDSKKLSILELVNIRWYNACAWYAVSLSYGLQKRGHRVIVGGDPESPPVKEAQKLGLETYSSLWLSKTDPFTLVYNLKRLCQLLDRERIDIINAHRSETHLLSSLASRFGKNKIPVVRTRGDTRPPKKSFFNRYSNNSLTDRIITTSLISKENYLENLNTPEGKIERIIPGIDEDLFFPQSKNQDLKEELKLNGDCVVVGIVGRLSPVKGHGYFIRAADYVLKNCSKKIKFVIAGEDAQIKSQYLKDLTVELGIKKDFFFIGRADDIKKVISIFDIGVISSIDSEMVCRVALEYMAMAKPVVGTMVNAIPEVIKDGINGILVPPKSGTSLGNAILDLIKNEVKRSDFGKKGRELVEREFNLDNFTSKTEEVYYQVLKEKGGGIA